MLFLKKFCLAKRRTGMYECRARQGCRKPGLGKNTIKSDDGGSRVGLFHLMLRPVIMLLLFSAFFSGCYYISTVDNSSMHEGSYKENTGTPDTTKNSDEYFINIRFPNKDVILNPGDTIQIAWDVIPEAGYVTIKLFRYGNEVLTLASGISNTGIYQWSIPMDINANTEVYDQYQIFITSRIIKEEKTVIYSGYSACFTIQDNPASGGLSDVTVTSRSITITLTDNGSQIDGDTITVLLNGTVILSNHVLIAAPGTSIPLDLVKGRNTLEVAAVNEGTVPPNTAKL
ncbi:MAG: Ser-Thr-rich GPI-anchored membrane family protein, partial [Spirochaetota bacterium]